VTVATLPPGVAAQPLISQWVSFHDDGTVELRNGKVDLGQGISTAIIQIAAEELDIAPARIRLISGDTRRSPDESFTAGSLSVERGGAAVRLVASATRQVFLAEAVRRFGGRVGDIEIEDGMFRGPGFAGVSYWSLAQGLDLAVSVADHAEPKEPARYRLVGREFPRVDLASRWRGGAFIHDLAFPRMLHGRIIRPPRLRVEALELDAAAAANLPGSARLVRDGCFLGVLAAREQDAVRAADIVAARAEWRGGADIPSDPAQEISSYNGPAEITHEAGTPQNVVQWFEGRFSRQFIAHASIGTVCAVAVWVDGALTVWSQAQGVFALRTALSTTLGLAEEAVDVVHVPGAGCYGHNGADDVALDAALLARAVPGTHVRVVWSRADELSAAPLGPAMMTLVRAGIDENRRIVDLRMDICSAPHSCRPTWSGGVNLLAARHLAQPLPTPLLEDPVPLTGGGADRNAIPLYHFAHVEVAKRINQSLPIRTSALRSLGGFVNVFALEAMMDDVALALGEDAARFRIAHLDDARAVRVIERVMEMSSWPGTAADGSALGIGFAQYKNRGAYCAIVAEVEVGDDLRVVRAWAAVDAGLSVNPDGVRNQVEGGMIQSISWALKEQARFEDGVIASRDWETYPILKFNEMPELRVEVIQRLDMPPLGAGETAQGPMAAAIGNAARRALGVRLNHMPFTRERIVEMLG
jgi:nicotinate dehydrogenase subunit B